MSKKTPDSQIIIYRAKNGKDRIDVRLQDETVWLTQESIAQLFQTTSQNIIMHIQAIYKEKELSEMATCKKYLQVRLEGKRHIQRRLKHYNLDISARILEQKNKTVSKKSIKPKIKTKKNVKKKDKGK